MPVKMIHSHTKIGELLVRQGVITHAQLHEAIAIQKKVGGRLGDVLTKKMGLVTEQDILNAVSAQLNIPFASLQAGDLAPAEGQNLDRLLPYEFAKEHCVLPLFKDGDTLTCALEDPLDLDKIDNIKLVSGCVQINPVIATRRDLITAIQEYYTLSRSKAGMTPSGTAATQNKAREAMETAEDSESPAPAAAPSAQVNSTQVNKGESDLETLVEKAEEAPVIKLVDLIIQQAIDQRASDIHLEPFKDRIILRYRIDGVLYEIPPPNKSLYLAIVSRLKILAKLDIAEKRLPQDGAITVKVEDRYVDLRVSTVPTVWGEKVVMRILDKGTSPLQLSQLGFLDKQLDRIKRALKKPYGLFFVTGPTGSGKSTTLYAALNEMIDSTRNIMTAEDPVEYKMEGVNQVSVKPEIGLTFAAALRAFLRQDPDVIMVGEVRDLETAQICTRAALTGHFVLSTLHTNDAASAVTRLLDIGIEPFLLTPSLVCIVAQRLARRLCPKCKEPIEPDPDLFGGITFNCDLIYKPKGCEECNHTGYRGRIVVTETMPVSDGIRELISKRAGYREILDLARKEGMDTLFEDGLKKVEMGITSFDEVVSVTTAG